MKLKNLLENIPGYQLKGSKEIILTGISSHSKQIAPGNLFIAKKGIASDGRLYLNEAVEAGASAIVTDSYETSLQNVVQVIHPNPAAIEAQLASTFFQNPSQELFMVGITGTNGKTTTSYIIKSLLDRIQEPCGVIGSIEYIAGSQRYRSTHATPDVVTNHKLFREMLVQGCTSAVMEVTSHGLDQGRTHLIDFDCAIFTNLTQDHLDYHVTMENYCAAKNKFFRNLGRSKWAIVNHDSPWTSKVIEGCSANILSYGIDVPADVQASNIILDGNGTHVTVSYEGESVDCFWPLVGRFNVSNCLAAIACLLTRNIPLKKIAELMTQLPHVRGRMEAVNNPLGLKIYVDHSHSDDSLSNALGTLKALKNTGRLIVVFGCGGDRDRSKRPKMAQACEQWADISILTSDNPRSEDPEMICEEARKGFTKLNSHQVIVDRRAAIQKAIEIAGGDDLILIAGKGHETKQIFAHHAIEFDDRQVAAECCAQLASFQSESS